MQIFRHTESDAAIVGWGVRVMLLTAATDCGVAWRLAGLGGNVEAADEIYGALAAMINDPAGYDLFVMECDGFGGIEAGLRVFGMLTAAGLRQPVMLVTRDCTEQRFPEDRSAPITLRAPLSAVSLRVGFEHALRDQLVFRAGNLPARMPGAGKSVTGCSAKATPQMPEARLVAGSHVGRCDRGEPCDSPRCCNVTQPVRAV